MRTPASVAAVAAAAAVYSEGNLSIWTSRDYITFINRLGTDPKCTHTYAIQQSGYEIHFT